MNYLYTSNIKIVENVCFAVGRCEPVPTVENAVPDNILSTSRNLVTYTCNPGYVFDDNVFQQTIQCINGVWNISLHACRSK